MSNSVGVDEHINLLGHVSTEGSCASRTLQIKTIAKDDIVDVYVKSVWIQEEAKALSSSAQVTWPPGWEEDTRYKLISKTFMQGPRTEAPPDTKSSVLTMTKRLLHLILRSSSYRGQFDVKSPQIFLLDVVSVSLLLHLGD